MNKKTVKVMFVCLGNICRSPAAECILRAAERNAPLLEKLISRSSGTSAYHGNSGADPRMVNLAMKRGYSIQTVTKQYEPSTAEEFEYIIPMDKPVFKTVVSVTEEKYRSRITLFTDFCRLYNESGVPDPYYGNGRYFEHAFNIIEDGCMGLLEHIRKMQTDEE